jgi:hypothetical protein
MNSPIVPPPSSHPEQGKNSKIDQAVYNYHESIAMYYRVLGDELRLRFTLTKIYIVLAVVIPIALCIFMSVGLWLIWTFGDALLNSLS